MSHTDLLGQKVKDRITGFGGVVTGYVYYISGCNQCLVVPQVGSDGKQIDGAWFDVQRLEIDADAKRIVLDNGKTPGFDAAPPRR